MILSIIILVDQKSNCEYGNITWLSEISACIHLVQDTHLLNQFHLKFFKL